MSVCLFLTVSLEAGWASSPQGDETVMIRCTRKAAELPTRCSEEAPTLAESRCERDGNPELWAQKFPH